MARARGSERFSTSNSQEWDSAKVGHSESRYGPDQNEVSSGGTVPAAENCNTMDPSASGPDRSERRRLRGGATTPTAILAAEHDLIFDVVQALEAGLDRSAKIDRSVWENAVGFLRSFGAQHHAKENIVLLAALERRGIPATERTLRAMVEEHEEEAALLDTLAQTLAELASERSDAAVRFRQAARAYAAHLRTHMEHEARHLFPMAERELSAEDERDVLHRFLLFRHATDGEDEYERLLALASQIRRQA